MKQFETVARRRATFARYSTTPQVYPRPFKYHIGISFAGKAADAELLVARQNGRFSKTSPIGQWRDVQTNVKKNVDSKDAGQDFFYVQEMRNQSGISVGVADGVGGWVTHGVDPSLFSQALMFHAARYAKQGWATEPESEPNEDALSNPADGWELTPMGCLELAYQAVLRERTVQSGSSTACIVNLSHRNGLLRSANLGDSGFLIIRGTSLVYMQKPQVHAFNFPWQLAKLPSGRVRSEEDFTDYPHDAQEYSTTLRGGDVIIAYTDGLSDNVFVAELLSICSLVRRTDGDEAQQAQSIADRIVTFALSCMHNRKKASPFEKAALHNGLYFRGGKVDDVTVLVIVVTEDA